MTRRAVAACLAAALLVGAAPVARHDGTVRAQGVPPPSKRVYMITDSVGLGAERAMAATFGPDWQFVLDGDAGEFTETLANKYVRPRITQTPWVFGDYAIVAAGYNYPYWDPERFDRSIDLMVHTLAEAGVQHVFWVTLREVKPQYVSPGAWRQIQPYYWYFPTVNDHLEAALARHPNLSLIDWAAVADQPGLTYDAIHLNTAGAALYSAISRQAIIDSRTAVPAGSITRIAIPDSSGVTAVALNLTSVSPRTGGFLTAYPCGSDPPLVSNHNHGRGEVVAHAAVVPVAASGEVCILNHASTNLVVDITGRFGEAAGITGAAPSRIVDTRDLGARQPAFAPLAVQVGSPGAPVVLNVTAVDAEGPGWVRAAPCDSTSTTSTLNVAGGGAVPNVAVVVPGSDGTICVTASVAAHLIVDRFMAFDDTSELAVAEPRRVLDTRDGGAAPLPSGAERVLTGDALGVDDTTTGVLLNLTVTEPGGPGFLAAYPCSGGRPETSNLNYGPGDTVANFVIVEPDANGEVCVATHASAHVVVDALGTIGEGFTGGTPQRLLDTRIANLPAGWP